ncbi:BTAD domain-containing putative transcriptional regulator, partial [Marinitenerispora sediminis]|uniref:BTAD domain-containing putative transcriptional regulator n=1 Tax=Marinitenerispora sediminis TaxID=1931232 RepID=UPI000E0495F6
GRHRELVPELRDLVAAHPLNEWFHARLIEALRRAGRSADALRAFEELSAVPGRGAVRR